MDDLNNVMKVERDYSEDGTPVQKTDEEQLAEAVSILKGATGLDITPDDLKHEAAKAPKEKPRI